MIRLAAIFKNGMILQRNSCVRIWGESDENIIEIIFCDNTYTAEFNDKEWKVDIQTGMSTEHLKMDVISRDKKNGKEIDRIVINDILLGEVWLAGGQSNMELELQNSSDGEMVISKSNYSDIRFYNVPKCAYIDDELYSCEEQTEWKSAVGSKCKDVSAVAYYFAVKLYKELKVPIGIIDCYWGGTSATCWVDEKALDSVPEVKEYINEWKEVFKNKSDNQYLTEMESYNKKYSQWIQCVDKLRGNNPDVTWTEINSIAGMCPWPQPKGRKSPFRPFGLHETMLKRVAPYGIRGFIYYQGEEDVERAEYYSKLCSAVISQWRKDFSIENVEEEKPFIITQLPMYIESDAIDDKAWCILRSQQEKCCFENENVSMAVLIDCGERDNIHPINKKNPGNRLAISALDLVYRSENHEGYMSINKVDFMRNTCELYFNNEYKGVCFKKTDGMMLTADVEELIPINLGCIDEIWGFEISNNSIEYYRPQILVKDGKILLIGQGDDPILNVRYGWYNFGVANVYNSKAMPLAPFCIAKGNE